MFSFLFSAAFVHAAAYITPMRAQEALYTGEAWRYDAGRLLIGGAVLIGLSGRPYRFASAATAAIWCEAGRRVIEAERATVERLSESVREAWIARKRERLEARADAILDRAAGQPDAAKRAALLDEAAWCQVKWV